MCEIKEQEQFNVTKMRIFGKTREWQNIKLRGRLKLDQEFEFYFIGNAKLLNLGTESTQKGFEKTRSAPVEGWLQTEKMDQGNGTELALCCAESLSRV